MPLFVPGMQADFDWWTSNHTGRPSASMGTAISAGSAANVFSSYQTLIAASLVTYDVYGVMVNINANTVSASARDTLVNIGASPAGGAYGTIIPNLLGSCAPTMSVGPGHWYYFPLFIPSGTAIGGQASINSSNLGNVYIYVMLFGQPSTPEIVKYGTYVFSVGAVAASSAGTLITVGTTNEGAWTALGSAASSAWWWQLGAGCSDNTMNALTYACDLGAGSPQTVVLNNVMVMTHGTAETMSKPLYAQGNTHEFDINTVMYGRMQCSGTADSNLSLIAYGLG